MGCSESDRVDIDCPKVLNDADSIAAHPLGHCEEKRSATNRGVENACVGRDRPGRAFEQVENVTDDLRGRVMNSQSALAIGRLHRFPNEPRKPRTPLPRAHATIAHLKHGRARFDGNALDDQSDIDSPFVANPPDNSGDHSCSITGARRGAGRNEPEDLGVRSPRDPRQRGRPAGRRSRTSQRSASRSRFAFACA